MLVSASPTAEESLEREVLNELEQRFEEAYDANGVDRSLIRWSLSRTPTERVMAVEETLNALATLKRRATPEGA
jgi:hypothetical protein